MPPERKDRARLGETGKGAARVVGARFTVRVWLQDPPAGFGELYETVRRVGDVEPHFYWDPAGRAVMALHLIAADLWIALLLAMNVVTATGHRSEQVEAMSSNATTAG